jgi:cell wall-associated NlpC family hydrolase
VPLDGKAGIAVAGGALLVYSGARGYSILKAVQNIVQGANPNKGQTASLIGVGTANSASGTQVASGSSNTLVAAMEASIGHAYVFGGAPGPNGANPWDCSSCVNFNANKRAGLPIPGYAPNTFNSGHGPATLEWLATTQLTTIGHSSAVALPGDICVWQTHMGVCTGPNQMVSAQNPRNGTRESEIDGFIGGEVLFIRRYQGGKS